MFLKWTEFLFIRLNLETTQKYSSIQMVSLREYEELHYSFAFLMKVKVHWVLQMGRKKKLTF